MPRPCGGIGGSPRPGADTDAGLLFLADLVDAGRQGFMHLDRERRAGLIAIDPTEVLESVDRRLDQPDQPGEEVDNFIPRRYGGAPLFVLDLMSFCEQGPPPASEIHPVEGIANIAYAALAESWMNNCTCEPANTEIPVYPYGCTSYGHTIGRYTPPSGAIIEHHQEWTCLDPPRYFKGLPSGQPYFRYTVDGRYAWCLPILNFRNEPGLEIITPEYADPEPDRHEIILLDYHPCPGCMVQPIPRPPWIPPIPSLDFPPIPTRIPPRIPGPPILIILPPTDCQFTAECKRKLDETHEVLNPDSFPAKLPETLYDPSKEGEKQYKNYPELLEWLIKQIDGIFGEFPIKIKYKDAQNEEHTIKVENQSEAMAEALGLLIGIAADTETATQLGMKAIVETIRSTAAATLASDYAKANAEFLGYRSKNTESDIKLSINPGTNNLKDALKESTKKIQRFKFDDSADLQDYLRKLLIGVGIVKAAFYRPFGGLGDFLPGDRIRDEDNPPEGYETQEDAIWRQFLAEVNEPPTRYQRDENLPSVKVDNVSTAEPPRPPSSTSSGS